MQRYNFDGLDPDDENAVEDVVKYLEGQGRTVSRDEAKDLLRRLKETAEKAREFGTEGEEDDTDDGSAKS